MDSSGNATFTSNSISGSTLISGSQIAATELLIGSITLSPGLINFALTAATATAGAGTLPANPAGFLQIQIAGVDYRVPYYNT